MKELVNQEMFLIYDGLRIHVKLDFPEGTSEEFPLVILSHGFTGNMEETHIVGISNALTGHGYGCMRVELYGHGQSDGDFKDHTQLKWISQLLFLVDYARELEFVTDIYLSGHSAGGMAVVLAGAMKEDVLKAIIPLAPALNIAYDANKGEMLGNFFDPRRVPDTIDFGEGNILGGNYVRAARFLPVDAAIRSFKKPVLIVHGDRDETVPFEFSENAARLYENCILARIPGDDHCFDYHLDLVKDRILQFLDDVNS